MLAKVALLLSFATLVNSIPPNLQLILGQCIGRLGILTDETSPSDPLSLPISERSVALTYEGTEFTIREYEPDAFRRVRRAVGVTDEAFVRSISNGPLGTFESNSLGSRNKKVDFFWSAGKQFMIKSLTEMEVSQVAQILPSYLQHLDNQPGSLLTRFCALYTIETMPTALPLSSTVWERIRWPFRRRTRRHYVVMKNSLHPSRKMSRTFDLKGSTLGRRSLPQGSKVAAASDAKRLVLKDLDYLESGSHLQLAPLHRRAVADQLEADVNYLNSIAVMDYSLLLAYSTPHFTIRRAVGDFGHRLKRFFLRRDAESSENLDVFLGIIDFLQPYTWKKWMETRLKSMMHDLEEVSAVDPNFYAQRFKYFMLRKVFPCGPRS